MLSVIDVIKALSILIEYRFPSYPVMDMDATEGFPRPSYFIDIDEVRGENVTSHYVRETADLSLYFLEENVYQGFLKLLEMKNELLELLNEPLPLRDDNGNVLCHVVFNNLDVTVNKDDKSLVCTMTSELIQERVDREADLPYIEDLETNFGTNNYDDYLGNNDYMGDLESYNPTI